MVTVEDIGLAREERAERQADFLGRCPVIISLSLNIPGPVKLIEGCDYLFEQALCEVKRAFGGDCERRPWDEERKTGKADSTIRDGGKMFTCESGTPTAVIAAGDTGENGMPTAVIAAGEDGKAEIAIKRAETGLEAIIGLYEPRFGAGKCEEPRLLPEAARALAAGVKRDCVNIEESRPMFRLLDLDVLITEDGRPSALKREKSRLCLICGREAALCARSRAHSVEELRARAEELIFTDRLISSCRSALLGEARLSPKPGLVDAFNSGAHKDMDLSHFERGAAAILPFLYRMTEQNADLITLGKEAEAAMLAATGGVNTQKGLIYSMGLIVAAAAQTKSSDPATVLPRAAEIAKELNTASGTPQAPASHGELVKAKYNAPGIKEEARAGFPSLKGIALPAYGKALETYASQNTNAKDFALKYALLALISEVSDTTVLYRTGPEGLEYMHREAAAALSRIDAAPAETDRIIAGLDADFTARNISPGGCADLLALLIFFITLNGGSLSTYT